MKSILKPLTLLAAAISTTALASSALASYDAEYRHHESKNFSLNLQDEVPGLRFRSDEGSLFQRSATAFETELGMDTTQVLEEALSYLEERFGIVAACDLAPTIDLSNSDFTTGNIVFADGAWGLFTQADLDGGDCPASPFDSRLPSFYLETISQKAGKIASARHIVPHPFKYFSEAKIVQVLVIPFKDDMTLGGTFQQAYGDHTLTPINPANLTAAYNDMSYGYMQLEWFPYQTKVLQIESLVPTVNGLNEAKHQTMKLEHPQWGTGLLNVTYQSMATAWAEDPEFTGNAALGIPRNPILTPKTVNFTYNATATFPYDESTTEHAQCLSDFSNPEYLKICPSDL